MTSDKKNLTPTASILVERVGRILAEGREKHEYTEVMTELKKLKPSDFDELGLPSLSAGAPPTDDIGFCRRLASRLFGVTSDTLDELPANSYIMLLRVVAQSFLLYMAEAIPD